MREIIPVVRENVSLKTEVSKLKNLYWFFSEDQASQAKIKTTALSVETYKKV